MENKIKLTKKQITDGKKQIADFMNLKFDNKEGVWQPQLNGRKDITRHELRIDFLSNDAKTLNQFDSPSDNKNDLLYFPYQWSWLMPALFQLIDEWDKHRESVKFHHTKFWGDFTQGLYDQDILAGFSAVVEGMQRLNEYIENHK